MLSVCLWIKTLVSLFEEFILSLKLLCLRTERKCVNNNEEESDIDQGFLTTILCYSSSFSFFQDTLLLAVAFLSLENFWSYTFCISLYLGISISISNSSFLNLNNLEITSFIFCIFTLVLLAHLEVFISIFLSITNYCCCPRSLHGINLISISLCDLFSHSCLLLRV